MQLNQGHIRDTKLKQDKMQNAQRAYQETIEKKYQEVIKRLQEQKEAASIAHYESLKYAYGDLDADIAELQSWSSRKTTIRSEANILNAFFGKCSILFSYG